MFSTRELFKKEIIRYEGKKYTDGVHPYDPGGPTKYGITLKTLRAYYNKTATAEDVKNLRIDVALMIYIKIYWTSIRGDDLPLGVDFTVSDYGVNSGTRRAAKVLQAVVGVNRDGKIGHETLEALRRRDPEAVIDAVNDERMNFLQGLKIWPTYKNGWTRRVKETRETSHRLARNAPQPQAADKVMHTHAPAAVVPPPTAIKNTVKTAGGGSGVGAAANWYDWFVAHPYQTVAIVALSVFIFVMVLRMINKWHEKRAEEPHPAVRVVPVKG